MKYKRKCRTKTKESNKCLIRASLNRSRINNKWPTQDRHLLEVAIMAKETLQVVEEPMGVVHSNPREYKQAKSRRA